jgi:hypothetical protein
MASMGIGGWRVKKQMKHPERGILQVTEVRDTQHGVHVTGIITAPGIRPTVVEHKSEDHNQWTGVHKVPVMVDRADPSKFEVLWYEVESGWSEQDELPQQAGMDSYQPNATVSFTSTVVTTGPDGTTVSTSMSPEAAAHLEAVLGEAFGQGGLLGKAKGMRAALNEMRNQALSQGAQRPQGAQGAQGTQWSEGVPGPYGAEEPAQPGYAGQGFPQPPDSQAFPQVDPRDFGPPDYPPQE